MDKTSKIILVTGATGQQGGATARHLLEKGWRIRALSRAPQKSAAQDLRQAGAEVVQGDIDDRDSLEAAMQGVYGVFSVQPHSDDEARQGKNVADTALAAGVRHFIYTSVGGAEDLYHVRVNVGKWEIEQHIQELGLPATILRPAGFMDSLASPAYGVTGDVLAIPIKSDALYPLIAVSDVGAFAALAFDAPDEYLGKTIELAGDTPTPPQIAAAISHAIGRTISYVHITAETLRQNEALAGSPELMEELLRASEYLNRRRFKGDISALRKLHPGLMDFETWLQREGKVKFEALDFSRRKVE
jgi:uncharacterized protein YbjT (DUF2867 family)